MPLPLSSSGESGFLHSAGPVRLLQLTVSIPPFSLAWINISPGDIAYRK
jgi:hypothetical protein